MTKGTDLSKTVQFVIESGLMTESKTSVQNTMKKGRNKEEEEEEEDDDDMR